MTVVLEKKNGGPYTKKEQEKRKDKVYSLHFEKGYSAVKIAEILGVSRNTINGDIKYWYSNIKEEVMQANDDYIIRQIGRLETQRRRIVEKITENQTNDSIKYEKMLLEMDVRINNLLIRINSALQTESKETPTQEDKIRIMVLFLLIKHSRDYCLTKEKVNSEIINLQQCTADQSSEMFLEFEKLGLHCCKKIRGSELVYDLMEFAFLRRYLLPGDSFVVIVNSLFILYMHNNDELRRLEKKFKEKYGAKERWREEVFEEFDKEKIPVTEKYEKARGEMIVDALENISDFESIKKYMEYINVFFRDERTLREKMIDEW